MTHAEMLSSWPVHGELASHTVQQPLAFPNELEDVADERRALPANVILAECEPRLVTRLRRVFGRG
jgi:hypothetical protein